MYSTRQHRLRSLVSRVFPVPTFPSLVCHCFLLFLSASFMVNCCCVSSCPFPFWRHAHKMKVKHRTHVSGKKTRETTTREQAKKIITKWRLFVKTVSRPQSELNCLFLLSVLSSELTPSPLPVRFSCLCSVYFFFFSLMFDESTTILAPICFLFFLYCLLYLIVYFNQEQISPYRFECVSFICQFVPFPSLQLKECMIVSSPPGRSVSVPSRKHER